MDKSQVKNRKKCGVYQINYHFVWTPKRRASVLNGLIAENAKEIITNVSVKHDLNIEAMEVMPDHIHVFVSAPPTISPHKIVKYFKGATSNILRKKFPQLLKLPSLWSSSYYCGTIGSVSESVVKHYIESQKGK